MAGMTDQLRDAVIGAVAGNIGNGGDRQLVQQTFDTFNRQQQTELDSADIANIEAIGKNLSETTHPIIASAYEKLAARIVARSN